MNRLALFPLTHDAKTILRYKELIERYELQGINSFKEDKNLQSLRKLNICESVSSEIPVTINKCDSILLLDNVENYKLDKYEDVIEKASDKGKEVLISQSLFDELQLMERTSVTLLESDMKRENIGVKHQKSIRNIENPIIGICGMGKNCSKFESLLMTLRVLKESGYKSLVMSPNPLITLFGGITLPRFLYSDTISMEVKIFRFNEFVYEKSIEEEIDIILIEIPGGIFPLYDEVENHFSEIGIVISRAIKIDIGILNHYIPARE